MLALKIYNPEVSMIQKQLFFLVFIPLFNISLFASTMFPNYKAHSAYQQKDFNKAKKILEKEQVENPNDPLINFNLGTIYYKQKNYDLAKESFQRAATHAFANNKELLEKSYFNLGNSFYQKALSLLPPDWEKKVKADSKEKIDDQVLQQAITAAKNSIEKYENTLKTNSENQNATDNKKAAEELLKKLMQKQQQQQNQQQDKKDQDKKQDQQQKQDQKNQDQQNQQQQKKDQENQDKKQNQQQQKDQKEKEKQQDQQQQQKKPQDEKEKQNQEQQQKQRKKEQEQQQDKQDKEEKKEQQQKHQQQRPEKQEGQKQQAQPTQQKKESMEARRMRALLQKLQDKEKDIQKKLMQQKMKAAVPPKNTYQKPW